MPPQIRQKKITFRMWYNVPSVVCVLPMPVIKITVEAPPPPTDMYEINVQKNRDGKAVSGEFGFHTATAILQSEGSTPHLTQWDVSELNARGFWGNEKTKIGRTTNAHNARAKTEWHSGLSAAQIGGVLRLSDSWAEKRCAAFQHALSLERGGK